MKIGDLVLGMKNVSVEGIITEKGETISFISRRTGKNIDVAKAKISDGSGEITLVLWNKQIDMVNDGDRVAITGGYVNEFKGILQLNVGRNGKIEVI